MISFVPNRHRNHDKCPRIGYISAGQLTALKENPGSGILQFSSTPEPVLRLGAVRRYQLTDTAVQQGRHSGGVSGVFLL